MKSHVFTKRTLYCIVRSQTFRRYASSTYEQIPEHLKIHMFTPELRVIREDELKKPFGSFSSNFILELLKTRSNEVRMGNANSNPDSRIDNSNIVRFMKVASRLKQLFELNGGNTEILDAVLRSQSTLDALEAKLAAKKAAAKSPRSPPAKPESLEVLPTISAVKYYAQIPDASELFSFIPEVKELRSKLGEDFANVSSSRVLEVLESYSSTARLAEFKYHLEKLLDKNGGATIALDLLIQSQAAFDRFENRVKLSLVPPLQSASASKILETSISGSSPSRAYKQVPDDCSLHEYQEELLALRAELGTDFVKCTSWDVLKAASRLSKADNTEGLEFGKLYRNLALLFKYNNEETFVLDNVLLNVAAAQKVEQRISSRPNQESLKGVYRKIDHVFALLEKHNKATLPANSLAPDLDTSSQIGSLSREEQIVFDESEEELSSIKNLTAESIRESYAKAPPQVPLGDKELVEQYLRQVKQRSDEAEERLWRQKEAFEWSEHALVSHRSLEAKNFFNTASNTKRRFSFPMFLGSDPDLEYLVLTANGQQYLTAENPLGVTYVPRDMFAILKTLPESDLSKFAGNVEKLRKRNWRLIGGGKNEGMLVLSRSKTTPKLIVRKLIKGALLGSGFCFLLLLAVDFFLTDTGLPEPLPEDLQSTSDIEKSTSAEEVKGKSWARWLWS